MAIYTRKSLIHGVTIICLLTSNIAGDTSLHHVLLGINIGLNSAVGPTYLSEISPDNLVSFFGVSFQLGCAFGIFFAQLFGLKWIFGTSDLWVFVFGVSIIISVIQIILAFWAPESYVYYSYHGKHEEALKRN